MKAIIMGAGVGKRLYKYATGIPKGMLVFCGQPLMARQIACLKACGITDISILCGYAADKINFNGVKYYKCETYETTNMVESLTYAQREFDDDVLLCYADILYEKRLILQLCEEKGDYIVMADTAWQDYWKMRYGRIDYDIESFKIDRNGKITDIGKPCTDASQIDARYIGLLKMSADGLHRLINLYAGACERYGDSVWDEIGRPPRKAFMTDILQALIDGGETVKPSLVKRGWVEFDTNEDYELLCAMKADGSLKRLIDL